jgi:hypothetical protein
MDAEIFEALAAIEAKSSSSALAIHNHEATVMAPATLLKKERRSSTAWRVVGDALIVNFDPTENADESFNAAIERNVTDNLIFINN